MGGTWTEAQARASAAYEAKTNKQFQIKLRLDEDADIIADLEESMQHGIKKREWLREMYEGRGVSVDDVRKALKKHGVDKEVSAAVIGELK